MKKMVNISLVYFIFAMAGGVFYREFTKLYGYTGLTSLRVVHTHLLVLGTFLFLLLALACKVTDIQKSGQFKRFLVLYNIALPLMVIMLLVRGIIQVLDIELGSGDAAVSGIAGVSHILLLIAFIFFFLSLRDAASGKEAIELIKKKKQM